MAKKPETKVKAEVVKPLAVEITFPSITDLKQALAFDSDGNLLIKVQFTSRVDQFEIFRLVNLLQQPHGVIHAVIGSQQSAMDFKFDAKADKVEIIRAAKALPNPKELEAPYFAKAEFPTFQGPKAAKIHTATFNHIETEERPFGVAIDYVAIGTGEIHTITGRGMNATEAVMAAATRILPDDVKEPFEVMGALDALQPSPDGYKLIRAIKVGSFDETALASEEADLKGS